MDKHMDKGIENLADRPKTSAIVTEMFEDVYEEMYASTVKTELLEDDQVDLCLSALKTEPSKDAPEKFYFCAVEMDGLEDDEFKEQSQYQLEQERLMRKRQRATERQRRYKAREKVHAEKLKAIASSQKAWDEYSKNCVEVEPQENSQTGLANGYLIEQLKKRNLKRKQAAERQKRFRESRKQKEEHLQATITTTDENSFTDITHLYAESTVKSIVSTNTDYVEGDLQIFASLNRAEQELDKLMEKRKKNRESQQRHRQAKKLKEMTAYAISSSQSSTDESQNAIEKIGPANVHQRGSNKILRKEYKKVPVFEKDLSSAQSVTKTGVSTTNVDGVKSQTQRNLQKDEPQKFYITQIKLGNVCHLEENDIRPNKEKFYIKQIKLGNVCDNSKKNVQLSEEERENNAKQNLLNFLAAQVSNAPYQAFAEQWEM